MLPFGEARCGYKRLFCTILQLPNCFKLKLEKRCKVQDPAIWSHPRSPLTFTLRLPLNTPREPVEAANACQPQASGWQHTVPTCEMHKHPAPLSSSAGTSTPDTDIGHAAGWGPASLPQLDHSSLSIAILGGSRLVPWTPQRGWDLCNLPELFHFWVKTKK